jgi:hypothetical protein
MSETRTLRENIDTALYYADGWQLPVGVVTLLRDCKSALEPAERSEPAAASVPLRQQVEEAALAYHKATDGTGEGEYGCPGVTCPGVQRLANFWFPFIARALSSAPGEREGR